MAWWYEKNGLARAPISSCELKAFISKNQMHKKTLVWCNGMAAWRTYESLIFEHGDDALNLIDKNIIDYSYNPAPKLPNSNMSQEEMDVLIAKIQKEIDSIEIGGSSNKEDMDRIRNKVFSVLPHLEGQQKQSIGEIMNNYDKMNKSLHDEENRKSNNIGIVWMLCLCIGPFAFHAIGAGLLMSVVISIIIAFVASREMK